MTETGVGGTPTRSQIEGWDTAHLEAAAIHWSAAAERWEAHSATLHSGILLQAEASADGAKGRAWADLVKARGLAGHLYNASAIARTGADDLTWVKNRALDAITEAGDALFFVGEDLSVTDRSTVPFLFRGARPARLAQAEVLAADIRTQAQNLAALDKAVAANIASALAPLGEVAFDDAPAD